jgi:guanidinopropionase
MAPFNKPVSGLVTPRFGGIATFMRLPHVPLDQAQGLDIGIVGIPWDGGTTNRPGAAPDARHVVDGPGHAPDHAHCAL